MNWRWKRSFFILLTTGFGLALSAALFVLLAAPQKAHAAAFNDAANGDWNIGTTWGGACASSCVAGTDFPAASDTVTIDSHTVTLTATHLASTLTISGGTLTMGAQTLTVTGNITISSGTFNEGTGTLNIGNGSNTTSPTINVATSETFYNLTVNLFSNSNNVALSSDTLIVTNTFTHTNGLINTGTISARGSVTIGSGADGGSASILFDQTGDQVITAGGGTSAPLDINKSSGTVSVSGATLVLAGFTLQSGTFTAPTTLTMIGNFTVSGGTFNEGTNTINFGNGTNSNSITANVATSETFYNLTVNLFTTSNNVTITSGDTLIVTNTLTHTNGQINTGTISARGNIVVGSTIAHGSGVILLDQTGDQTITGSGGKLPELRINKSSGTVTSSGSFIVSNFLLQAGTFVAPTTLGINGNFTISGGSFEEGTGTVNFGTGSSVSTDMTVNVLTTETFYAIGVNLFINSNFVTISSGDTLIVTNTFTHTNGDINTGTIRAEGNVVIASTADGGTATLTFDGSADQTYTDGGGDEVDGTFTVNKDSGTLTLASAMTVTGTGQDLTVSGGTLDLAGFALTVTDQFTVSSGGTLELFGDESITVSGAKNINSGSTVVFTGDGSGTDSYTIGNFSASYHHLTINSADGTTDTFAFGQSLDVNGNFTITAGTVTGGASTLTVAGDISIAAAAAFSGASMTLDGTNQAIVGDVSVVNFTKNDSNNNSTDLTLTMQEADTLTVSGTLTLDGTDANDRVRLVSSDADTAWLLDADTFSIDYVYVEDSDASASTMVTHTNTEDGGGNTNWGFNGAPSVSTLGPASYVDGSFGTDSTPTLTFTLADVDDLSDTVQFLIQIDDTAGFGSPVTAYTSALAAPGAATFTVGQAAGSGAYTTGSNGQTLPDGSYYWRVLATDEDAATSGYSTANSGSIAFKIDTTAPTAGTVSVGSAAETSLTATIAGASDAGVGLAASSYQFFESVTATYSGAQAGITWTKNSLTPNTSYTFSAGVYDTLGNAATTSTASAYTLANVPTSFVAAVNSSSQITLTWSANSNPAGTEYYVENTTAGVNSGWIADTTLVSTGLTADTTYTFTVKARNDDDVETTTATVSGTTEAAASGGGGDDDDDNGSGGSGKSGTRRRVFTNAGNLPPEPYFPGGIPINPGTTGGYTPGGVVTPGSSTGSDYSSIGISVGGGGHARPDAFAPVDDVPQPGFATVEEVREADEKAQQKSFVGKVFVKVAAICTIIAGGFGLFKLIRNNI